VPGLQSIPQLSRSSSTHRMSSASTRRACCASWHLATALWPSMRKLKYPGLFWSVARVFRRRCVGVVTAKSLSLPPTRPRENDVGGAWLAMVTRCRNREIESVSDTFHAGYGREMTQGGNNAVWVCQPCHVCRPAQQPCPKAAKPSPPTKGRSTGGRHQDAHREQDGRSSGPVRKHWKHWKHWKQWHYPPTVGHAV
jgi:hypothetical protein